MLQCDNYDSIPNVTRVSYLKATDNIQDTHEELHRVRRYPVKCSKIRDDQFAFEISKKMKIRERFVRG